MSSGIAEGYRFLSEPNSPPSVGLGISPRRSSSPDSGFDFKTGRIVGRKRANTSSSGGGGSERRIANKICRVCGDKAFSYNFNVITCESCKAFFRRNANKEKEIRCPFNEKCEINVVSRRFCQRCRLAKCFEVGMKKEWIMSDEARLEKKARVEENRERRMQDAMRRRQEEEGIGMGLGLGLGEGMVVMGGGGSREERYAMRERSRVKSESRAGDKEELPHSLREFVLANSRIDIPLTAPPPAAEIAAQLGSSPTCASHLLMDPIPTTAAHSLADVNATINCLSTMDVDPSTTMSSNGFLPPSVPMPEVIVQQPGPSTGPTAPTAILPVNVTNAVESSLMAQAQLAAAQVQVQAAINHQQHQIAAAVVAQQVAAQMATVAPQQQAPTPVIPPLAQTIAPQMTVPILTPSVPQPPAILSISSPINPDMVTIPREIFVKLMENSAQRSGRCTCQCVCGRYPPGSIIVDEVARDLVAAGNNSSSADLKEETKLETAEDFQRNGLLPSDDSSVQWLNTSAPVVDPSGIMEERSSGRRDSIYKSSIDRLGNPTIDADDFSPLTQPDHERLSDVLSANSSNPVAYESSYCWVINFDTGIERMVKMCKALSPFRALSHSDQFELIKNSCLPYLVIRATVKPDPTVSASGYPLESTDTPQNSAIEAFLADAANLFSGIRSDVREHEGAMLVFALLCVFDTLDLQLDDGETIIKEFDAYLRLLKRLLYSSLNDVVACSSEIRSLFEALTSVRDHSACLTDLFPSAESKQLHSTIRRLLQ